MKKPQRKRRQRLARRLAYMLSLAAALALAHDTSHAQGIGPHFGAGHLAGESVGLDDGYTNFGAFLPIVRPYDDVLLFSDTQLLLYNEQTAALGANLGLGARYYDAELNRIFGGYVYYDLRNMDLARYDQIGFGVETLGEVFDGRINVNLPTNTDVEQLATSFLAAPTFGGLIGQNIVVGANHFQQALSTVDVEGGALLTGNERWQLKGYLGAYGLFGEDTSEWGARGRIELRLQDELWVNGYVQNDPVFGTTGGMSFEYRFGVDSASPSSYLDVAARMGDPVQRRRHVAVAQLQTELLATAANIPITVLHVDSNASAGGTGGVNDPLNTLAAASNQPQDIVFVHGDSVFNGESMEITTLAQRFLGEGVPHTFDSDQGTFALPGVNPAGATPQILGAPGNAVTVAANDVEVSGFAISGAADSGIFGDGVSGFDVNRNTANQNGIAGIFFDNVNGTGSITDNIANENTDAGIAVVGMMTGDIAGNTADDNTAGPDATGIFIEGVLVGDLVGNTANRNHENGI
ncbi:MAG: right-handed parallel beta-helix repeat-containing protein, partial [Pirellulales bacterium]